MGGGARRQRNIYDATSLALPTCARRVRRPQGATHGGRPHAAVAQQVPELSFSNASAHRATQLNFDIDGGKGQSGCSAEARARYLNSAQNPVTLEANGNLLVMYQVPDLPQLPPSSALLRQQWPRLQRYAVTSADDPLFATCESGAAGDEMAAAACLHGWRARVPSISAQLREIYQTVRQAFPNVDADGKPYAGAYWNEADYDDDDWQTSHWGIHYPRLRAIKATYDPKGLFVCHHCVGSEDWTADQYGNPLNCRRT